MTSFEPHWHPEAILDAEAARNWYAERSPFAARGFVLDLDQAVTAITEAHIDGRTASLVVVSTFSLPAIPSRSSMS